MTSAERLARMRDGFIANVPHNRALGIVIAEVGAGDMTMRLPFDPRFLGNPELGVLHGGVITALLDACSGGAVFAALLAREEALAIATLDLRIDYLRPAVAGQDVTARATCYAITRNVAFVRASATIDAADGAPGPLLATAAGTFMLGTRSGTRARPPAEPAR